jgi:hypothetical protein
MIILFSQIKKGADPKGNKVDLVCTAIFSIPELSTVQKTQIAPAWKPPPEGLINVNTNVLNKWLLSL